jgi:hypothetical protein
MVSRMDKETLAVAVDVLAQGTESAADWSRLLRHMTPWRVLVVGVAFETGTIGRLGHDLRHDSIDGVHEEALEQERRMAQVRLYGAMVRNGIMTPEEVRNAAGWVTTDDDRESFRGHRIDSAILDEAAGLPHDLERCECADCRARHPIPGIHYTVDSRGFRISPGVPCQCPACVTATSP